MDLPAPERPVNHNIALRCPFNVSRRSRVTEAWCQTILLDLFCSIISVPFNFSSFASGASKLEQPLRTNSSNFVDFTSSLSNLSCRSISSWAGIKMDFGQKICFNSQLLPAIYRSSIISSLGQMCEGIHQNDTSACALHRQTQEVADARVRIYR